MSPSFARRRPRSPSAGWARTSGRTIGRRGGTLARRCATREAAKRTARRSRGRGAGRARPGYDGWREAAGASQAPDAQAGQVRSQDPQESEQNAQDGPQELVAPFEAGDPGAQLGERVVGDGDRRNRPRRPCEPPRDRRSRHAEALRDRRVARLLYELDEPMVVDLLAPTPGFHSVRVHRGGRGGSLGPTEPGGDRVEYSNKKRRVSWFAARRQSGPPPR